MFVPVIWLVMSSFKPEESLEQFPPTFLPYRQERVLLEGQDRALGLFDVQFADGTSRRLAQLRIIGRVATMIDPLDPQAAPIEIDLRETTREAVQVLHFELSNYTDGVQRFPFKNYLGNSLFVTITATAVTLL